MDIVSVTNLTTISEACRYCGTPKLLSFNYKLALSNQPITKQFPELKFHASYLDPFLKLRRGELLRCKECEGYWYLDADGNKVSAVPSERLPLIEAWNREKIVLTNEIVSILNRIGRTPPDIYGNGRAYHQTPCTVITRSGERYEFAIVCRQRHAPFEPWRNYRLASEIVRVEPSRFTLPLSIRKATASSTEVAMGYSPTRVVSGLWKTFTINGVQHFHDGSQCKPLKLRLPSIRRWSFSDRHPHLNAATSQIVYFVADLYEPSELD